MNRPLRVGMNLIWLRPGVVGGSEVAAVGTVAALADLADPSVDLRLYAQNAFVHAHPDLARRVPTRNVAVAGDSKAVRAALESTWLPAMTRRDRVDIVHCYGGVIPAGLSGPTVLTLHDVQPLEADAEIAPVKRRWLQRMIPQSVASASRIIVPSEFVRERLHALIPMDVDKVVVIPHGDVDPRSAEYPGRLSAEEVRRRFRLQGPFVVYPAITYRHKNHAVLVEALAGFGDRESAPTLVLTGSAGPADNELNRLIERRGVGDKVRRLGRVSGRELEALEREATLLAFPSRYEGFGLPILEAFGFDTPVVASSSASLPEVVGGAGLLIDPDDVAGWTDAFRAALDGEFSSAEATARRRGRSERFRWDRIVPDLIDVYRSVGAEEVR